MPRSPPRPAPPRPGPAEARARLDALHEALSRGEIGIGEAVRRMRHLSGLTQPDFARHRGISVQALRQIESGRGNSTVQTLDAIAATALVHGFRVVTRNVAGFEPTGAAVLNPWQPRD